MIVSRGLIVPCIINPTILVLIVPCVLSLYVLMSYFKNVATQTERLNIKSRNPVLICTKSTMDGLATIRGADMSRLLIKEFHKITNNHARPFLNRIGAQRCFSMRVDFVCFLFALACLFMSVVLKGIFILK